MKKYIIFFVCFLCWQLIFAQTTNFTFNQIDSIVKRIDSTCISGGITEYVFNKKGRRKKVIGSGADWFYTDTSGTKLLKVIREISLAFETFDVYYFCEDSLICLKRYGTYNKDEKTINLHGRFYFHNSMLVLKQDDLRFVFDPKNYLATARSLFRPKQIWRR